MRASYIAVIAAVLAIPSVAFAQQDGPVGGRVGSDLSTTTTPPSSVRWRWTAALWRFLCHTGVPLAMRARSRLARSCRTKCKSRLGRGGLGSAFIDGHRVLVDPSNRILRVIN